MYSFPALLIPPVYPPPKSGQLGRLIVTAGQDNSNEETTHNVNIFLSGLEVPRQFFKGSSRQMFMKTSWQIFIKTSRQIFVETLLQIYRK